MTSKRPLCTEENDQFQECMNKKSVVKVMKIDDKINQKKLLLEAIKSHDVTGIGYLNPVELTI